jgi:hypothetical protein
MRKPIGVKRSKVHRVTYEEVARAFIAKKKTEYKDKWKMKARAASESLKRRRHLRAMKAGV